MRATTPPCGTIVPTSATQAILPSTSEAMWESFSETTVPGNAIFGDSFTRRAVTTLTDGGSCGACCAGADVATTAALNMIDRKKVPENLFVTLLASLVSLAPDARPLAVRPSVAWPASEPG